MSRKRLLIAVAATVCAVLAIVIVSVIIVGVWLMRSSKSKATSVPTAVGTPKGSPIMKSIGPEGGTISSSDGRITVNVPSQAVSNSVNFSIQPITNMAPGGLGDAYRLEPNGRTFSTPARLTFKFTDADVAGRAPEALVAAYQDNAGIWQRIKNLDVDPKNKTCTVLTVHFTDFSISVGPYSEELQRLQPHIEPPEQTLRPGQSTYLEIVGCEGNEGLRTKFVGLFSDKSACRIGNGYVPLDWSTDLGIIETGKRKVKYTAPAKINFRHRAIVDLTWRPDDNDNVWYPFYAHITIEPGYKVSGQDGPMVYSGTICSLSKPFKVKVTHPLISYEINFVPDENHLEQGPAGRFSYTVTRGLLHMSGEGNYSISTAASGSGYYTSHGNQFVPSSGNVDLFCWESSRANGPMGIGSSGKGEAHIILTPLETNECDGK